MFNVLETNVLIIGKSGVGKSSLLNYIFDKNIMETGTGRPVTRKGVFTEKLKISDDFIINLSDTWGLEANKASEWQSLIMEEVKKHDCEKVSEWFHTIFFCISAKSARVEDFEKKIIKSLVDYGNKVIVVLTHADVNNIHDAIISMGNELRSIGIPQNNIIKVCSIGKKLLGGRTTQQFGKDEVINSIKNNLWETICNKLPKILQRITEGKLNQWYDDISYYIDENIKWHNCQSNKNLESISVYIEQSLSRLIESIGSQLNNKYDEAIKYYIKLAEKYNSVSIVENTKNQYKYNINFKIDIIARISENIKQFVVALIPLGIFFARNNLVESRKSEMKEKLNSIRNELIQKFTNQNIKVIEEMRNYYI